MTLQWDSQLIFNEAGYIYIQDAVKTYKTYNLTREDPGPREIFYHMPRIDHDGVFRPYKHLRDNTSDGSCHYHGPPCKAFLMIYVVHWPVIMLLLVMGSANPIAFVVPQIIQAGEHFANVLMNFLP